MTRKIPFFLAILSMIGGVFISILFAVNEEMFIRRIHAGLEKNIKIQQISSEQERLAKITTETEKNWRYYQRFHFHATGIGAMMLGLLLFLSSLNAPSSFVIVAKYMVSIGGFLYPFVWLFAGIYGPEMGRSEAKESFALFGYMGGVFLAGGVWTLWLGLRYNSKHSNFGI